MYQSINLRDFVEIFFKNPVLYHQLCFKTRCKICNVFSKYIQTLLKYCPNVKSSKSEKRSLVGYLYTYLYNAPKRKFEKLRRKISKTLFYIIILALNLDVKVIMLF